MKRINIFSLVIFLIILSYPVFCFSEEKIAQEEPFYQQLIRAVFKLEMHVSTCASGLEWANEKNIHVGTAFFVQDRINEDKTNYYVVTARHVVENNPDLFARVQIAHGSKQCAFLYLPRKLWIFNSEPMKPGYLPVDVAVMLIPKIHFMKAFLYCEKENYCFDKEKKKPRKSQIAKSPGVMERAMFFGFPSGDIIEGNFEPLGRSGIVALTDSNYIGLIRADDKNLKYLSGDSIYLLDASSFIGHSGGPVLREQLSLIKEGVHLLGLITGENRDKSYVIVTRPERIIETIKHARETAIMNKDAWSTKPPTLPIKCVPNK